MIHEIIQFNPTKSKFNPAVFIGWNDEINMYIVQEISVAGEISQQAQFNFLSNALKVASQWCNLDQAEGEKYIVNGQDCEMTLYSVPLNQSSAQSVLHLKSAQKQFGYWKDDGMREDSYHHYLMWVQLFKAVAAMNGDLM